MKTDLPSLGWNSQLDREREREAPELVPGRVVAVDRDRSVVAFSASDDVGHVRASLAGRLRQPGQAIIAVGDWVGLHENRIDYVFSRRSAFVRKRVGDASQEQIIAANVDWALVATSLNDDFSPRRVERFVLAAWDAGATPIVLLTKCDLVSNAADAVAAVSAAAAGADILVTSAVTGDGIAELRRRIGRGQTAVLVGSSGVGKSTLINALLGHDLQDTADVRAGDDKGRHTTTRRELIPIPTTGGLIIDTPGIREFGVLASRDGEGGMERAFPDIEELAVHCGFRDCSHLTEPDCAVLAAVEDGELSQARLDSYFKLERELAYNERRHDVYQTRQREKAFAAMVKQHKKHWK